jgi:hypothetical protein
MIRPRKAIRQELFRVLDAALSVPVVVQRQPKDAGAPLVMIEPPPVGKRGDIKRDTGHSFEQTIRVHTRFPKGKANIGKRESVAADVIGALNAATLDPTDHRIVHWPKEPDDSMVQTYEASGGEQAFDLLLTYDIDTQIKATI